MTIDLVSRYEGAFINSQAVILDELARVTKKYGLSVTVENITKVSQGGISTYVPTEANRHTKVMLYIK